MYGGEKADQKCGLHTSVILKICPKQTITQWAKNRESGHPANDSP
jgi:hypothetical protein